MPRLQTAQLEINFEISIWDQQLKFVFSETEKWLILLYFQTQFAPDSLVEGIGTQNIHTGVLR